jgi:AraC-like DNA-binding protein
MADSRALQGIDAQPQPREEPGLVITSATCPALARVGIAACGIDIVASGQVAIGRLGPEQAAGCARGAGTTLIGDQWRELAPGTCYLAPTQTPHAYRTTARTETVWVRWLPGRSGMGDQTAARLTTAPVAQLAAAVAALAAAQPTSPAVAHWAMLVDLLARRLRGPGDPRLANLWRAVLADLAGTWTLDRLTTLAGLSPERLRRRCQAELGVAPLEQVTRLRMHRAAVLLAERSRAVAEIATAVGYQNQFNFSTAFRRVLGVSPSSIRCQARPASDASLRPTLHSPQAQVATLRAG